MNRITVFLSFLVLLLVAPAYAKAVDAYDYSGILKNRKVIGVIYFEKNSKSSKLTKNQQAEINRISALVVSQHSPDKVVRVEGFLGEQTRQTDNFNTSLSRAKSVWYYLSKIDSFKARNLYLTGFSSEQSISKLKGERVEIAVYENPFDENIGIYSNN